jgi:hypothetical protein
MLRKTKNYSMKVRRILKEFWEECVHESVAYKKIPLHGNDFGVTGKQNT